MGPLPPAIIQSMSYFAPLFSFRVWPQAQVLLTGAILAPGKRTVSALLRVMGLDHRSDFQTYHRVLNRCVWSPLEGSQILLQVLLATFTPRGRLVFGLDDTIERRRGAHIAAKGIYRDPVRSSQGHFVKASGLRWLSLMLLVPVSWADRIWALPFLTVLCPSERYYQARGRAHQPLLERAQQMLRLVARWVPTRSVVVVADQAFSALAFLDGVRHQVAVITRLRLDAALFEPAPPRPTGTVGRPRCKGDRLPTLQARLDDPNTRWHELTIEAWYATGKRALHIVSGTAVWYHSGLPPVAHPLKKRAPIWVWKRNGSGMTKLLRAAPPWCWPYLLWWRFGRTPSSKRQPVASDKRLGIAKQNPLFRMHSLGSENTSGNIFQRQFHTQTGKNPQRQSSNALSISFAMLHEWIKSS